MAKGGVGAPPPASPPFKAGGRAAPTSTNGALLRSRYMDLVYIDTAGYRSAAVRATVTATSVHGLEVAFHQLTDKGPGLEVTTHQAPR